MRLFSVGDREFMALVVLSDFDDFEAVEISEVINGERGETLLEFHLDERSARLCFINGEIDIPLLRASLEIFREQCPGVTEVGW